MTASEVICPNPKCAGGFEHVADRDSRGPGTSLITRPCPQCARRRHVARLATMYAGCGLPDVLRGYRWPDDRNADLTPVDVSEPYWAKLKDYADDLPDMIEYGINLVLLGPPGTGKSQAGALFIARAAKRGYSALAVSAPDWVAKVANDYRPGSDGDSEYTHVNQLCGADLLLLDDIGADMPKDPAQTVRLLSRVITKRYEAMRPTIITSNLPANEREPGMNLLEAAIGDRAYERLQENAEFILMDGTNWRREAQRTRLGAFKNRRAN